MLHYEALVHAASELLAAIFGRLGYVGRPRRRASIREEIELLDRLRSSPNFGPESDALRMLSDHISEEIASYAGKDLKRKAWGSATFGLIVGLPLAYVTYKLNQDALPGSLSCRDLLRGSCSLVRSGSH